MKTTCNCSVCTESHEIKDMVFRRDTDTLIKKVQELRERWMNDDSDYYEAILDGSWPNAIPILEAALENARKLMATKKLEPDTNPKSYIIVNTEEHPISETVKPEDIKVPYHLIVQLANPMWVGRKFLTVTYRKGPVENPEGILIYNQSVRVKHGMIFNVADTSNA